MTEHDRRILAGKPLLFIRSNDAGVQVERRLIQTVEDLALILRTADFGFWIEGLGEPLSWKERTIWRHIGAFLSERIPAVPHEVNLDGTHV